ncbi:ParB/RepB/Spo0J family partition protein [Paraburkholderia susongensis]|uniref:Chromosome partitioning protein, ParB family n=1 Tax=Paraburkholderia susongensis TaxID=1515439 RepID=A0A1X7M856_9BURK|nr:ParB/RepB/Spo0J family partition protein [Paraburkholderia susongensis]SMG61589.1 chromosome partitioning protein, ParB family [Paraburkholderia susongensis]
MNVEASTILETDFGNETAVQYVAYSRLCRSPHNVRRKAPVNVSSLADSIAAKGLLQNMVVHVLKGSRGKQPKLGVCAGQRRLAALDLLASSGRIAGAYLVPVKVVSEAEAVAASLIENEQREPMHPADQCEAFQLLISEGRSAEYVAALFGVSAAIVHRRLKLANVSPKLLDVFRDDGMTMEQITALALTDVHDLQERLWFDAEHSWQREPRELRNAITQTEIDVRRSALARFVGVEAYEAAGGYVRRDLFSDDENAGYISDPDLLNRLAADRLTVAAQEVQAEGWGWVETRTKFDYSELCRFGTLDTVMRSCTAEEQGELDALVAARDEAQAKLDAYYENDDDTLDEDAVEKLQTDVDEAEEAVDSYTARFEMWDPEGMKFAGALVIVDGSGKLVIERGRVRREDRTKVAPAEEGSAQAHDIPRPVHSEKLCRRLTAHRTAAVQVELSRNPVVALAVLMNRLIPVVFSSHFRGLYVRQASTVNAECTHDRLLRDADDMTNSPAWLEIEAEQKKWAAMLPKQFDALLPWLLTQEQDVMANLFAFCVAATVDGIGTSDTPHAINHVANILEVDMTQYWKPTRERYLDHVSKARVLEVVSQAVSPEAANDLKGMKKGDAATAAELRLAETTWLPEVLTNRTTRETYVFDADDEQDDEAA